MSDRPLHTFAPGVAALSGSPEKSATHCSGAPPDPEAAKQFPGGTGRVFLILDPAMPDLTPERHEQLQRVFEQAAAWPAHERAERARRELADDPEVLAAFLALGDPSSVPTAFLDPIAEELAAGFRADRSRWHDPGRIGPNVGRYRLLSLLGEGGFGMVYEAEQTEPVRRRVALKVIKPGLDSRAVVTRFEAERQALALMDHPHIAKILDGGTTGPESGHQGLPYFAMELVRGDPIIIFCDRERLTIAQRLELMTQVCDAVEHAHKRGIIHRDIKPSNVLVAFHDGVAVPKIIDFGIAKAMGSGLTEHTLYTMRGQLIGTPAYMSPEQAEMSGVEIDERTDVYSLGVLLYEVLTSRPPFDPRSLHSAGHAEMVRIIREVAPQRPSTRLSTQIESEEGHESVITIARARRAELHALTRQLRNDLDWVVMKCLEKERDRRYESAGDLSDELRRILNHEPVEAGPPSVRYRTAKYYQRHKPAVMCALFFVVLVALFGCVVGVQAQRNAQLQRSLREAGSFTERFVSGTRGTEQAVTPRFAQAEPRPLPGAVAPQDENEIRKILQALGSGKALSEMQTHIGFTAIAKQLGSIIDRPIPGRADNKALLAEVLLLHSDVVNGLRTPGLGDADLARRGYERAAQVAEALPDGDARAAPLLVRARLGVGDTQRAEDIRAAERAYAEAQQRLNAQQPDPAPDPAQRAAVEAQVDSAERDLAVALARQCRLDEAERLLGRSLASRRLRAARPHQTLFEDLTDQRDVAVALTTLAEHQLLEHEAADAVVDAREALEIRTQILRRALRGSQQLLDDLRARARDESAAQDSVTNRDRWLGTFRRDVEVSRIILGRSLARSGDLAAARDMFGQAESGIAALLAEAPEDDRMVRTHLALALEAAENEIAAGDAPAALGWTERASERLIRLEQLSRGANQSLEPLRARVAYLDGRGLALARSADAIGRLTESVNAYKDLSDGDPAQASYATGLAQALAALAETRLTLAPARNETQAQARQELERARDLLENWHNHGPICGVTDAERRAVRESLARLPAGAGP
jgi:serine/threonine protein kinase